MIRYFKSGALAAPKRFVHEKKLMSMTIAQLKAIAHDRGIVLPEDFNKAQIVKALSESEK